MPVEIQPRKYSPHIRTLIKLILALGIILFFPALPRSQCIVQGPQAIPDDGTLTINFSVTGLTDNDLASPTQGICGVHLDFMHEFLGDLVIRLVSPSGTIIQLVGPATTASSPTNLSRWNVDFIPCMNTATPDAGFSAVWSNLQAWQVFTPYSGSYYPNTGCLEDFNTGPANGSWKLIIEDQDPLQTGTLTSASLIFCNPAGLQCVECNPDAGTLSPDIISLCEGDALSTSLVTVSHPSGNPDPALYSYTYILNNVNMIMASGASFSATPVPGTYTLCGLSYLTSDAATLNTLLATGDYSQVTTAVNSGTICGALTSTCMVVAVEPKPDTVVNNVLICQGETYVFRGQIYSNTGTYYVVDQTGICDSVYRLDITVSNLAAIIAVPDSITCGGSGVVLDGSLSTGTGITYQWSTEAGVLSGNVNSSQVNAVTPGTYKLTVRDGACETSAEVTVYGDNTYPRVFVDDGVLTCANPAITIHPVVFPSNSAFLWTGPGGFASTAQDIMVSTPGRYNVRVTGPTGCESYESIDITENKIAPTATILLLGNFCMNNFAVIGVNSFDMEYSWTDPIGQPISTDRFITIVDPGIYNVTITDPENGCTDTDSYNFIPDYTIPSINLSGLDSIRCNTPVTVTVADDNFGPPPHWTGPNGFVADGITVSLTQPGIYTLQVTGENLCMNSQTVEIFPASGYPQYQIVNDTISCIENLATIGIIAPEADVFNWPGIPPPESNNAFLQTALQGLYYVTALDTNTGCLIEATAFVFPDIVPPYYEVFPDTITCRDPVVSLEFIPAAGQVYASVQWQLPDMTIVNDQTIMVSEPGQFLLTVTGVNGCIRSSLVGVTVDTIDPVFFLEPDTLGCDLQGVINVLQIDSLSGVNWSGPGGFTSNDIVPMISDTGNYFAVGFGLNGCSVTLSTHVAGNFVQPDIEVETEEITCIEPDALQSVSSPDPVISYAWYDAAGNVIGTDPTIIISVPGTYYPEIEGENHCFTRDTVILVSPDYPEVNVTADTLTCLDALSEIMAFSNISDAVFAWLDNDGDTLVHDSVMEVSTLGPFIVSVTGLNGCTTLDTISVPSDSILPVIVLDIIGEVRCQKRDFVLDASGTSPSTVTFDWETFGGEILSQTDFPIIDARDTGLYVVTVIDTANGCAASDSIFVSEHPDAIKLAYVNVKRPECAGDANAEILITTLEGGVGPFSYRLDSMFSQSDKHFKGLLGGPHLIEITDSEGCIYDTLVFVKPSEPYIADAGPDQEIFIGDDAILSGSTDILPDELLTQDWDSSGIIFCMDCPESSVAPHVTSTYRFVVTSKTGCVVEDLVTVFVIEEGRFYVANIFSPNGDGANDVVYFNASKGTTKVLKWIIFDRWGNALFGKSDFEPNDPTVFWDGTAQGSEKLNPGVFPYVAEIELVNGSRRTHHGTITLIR